LEEFPDVMPKKLPEDLPLRRRVDHAIEVMPRVAPLAKAPYRMSHEELKELKVQLEELLCRNPSFGLTTKAKGLQGCGPKGSPGVTSGTPGSVGKCEGVNPHTPKATPTLGDGVPVDSRNFRDRFEGSNLNGLWRSLYQWKALEA
jgi:hypothetical protein